jgi:hypothetical protein
MTKLFQWFGLSPTQEQKKTSAMVKNGYPTKVVGRGAVMVMRCCRTKIFNS